MIVNTITEAKAKFSALIERARAGERVIISRAGKPVAMLVRYDAPQGERQPGAMEGEIWIAPDFDELPSDLAEAFGVG